MFAPLILSKTPEGNRLSGHKRSRFSGIVKFQSNFDGFAIAILVPQTGIALPNHASGFTLEFGHPNHITPAKRPFNLIIPSFLRWDDGTFGPMGVMGAPMQPQGSRQMAVNMVNHHFNPQTALDAPRWRFLRGNSVLLERGASPELLLGLTARGHQVAIADSSYFGKGQIILQKQGILLAACEPRSDGLALGY